MKTYKFFTIALTIIAISSCSKEVAQTENVKNEEKTLVQFTALANETKTSLGSDDSVAWTTGDCISVFSGTTNNCFALKTINPDGSGVFEGEIVAADTYYAVYPYSDETTIKDGVITTSIPSVQKPLKNGFANSTNLSVSASQTSSFIMKNVGSLMEININKTNVKAVTIVAKGDIYVSGKIDITIGNDGVPSYTLVSGSRTVTLVPDGAAFETGNYYAVVLPQTYTGGLNIIYATTDGQSATVSNSSNIEVQRSRIKNFGNVESSMTFLDVIDLVDPDGEGKTETANCYIPSAAGRRYSFPATIMGNGATTPEDNSYIITAQTPAGNAPAITPSVLAPKSAKLLWQTDQSLISDVTLIDGKVYLSTKGKTTDNLTAGNALIAVYSGDNCTGDILWSWHMWVTDANLDGLVQTWKVSSTYENYSNFKDPKMMDRNLGALTEKCWTEAGNNNLSHGLLYQWGRKDPFIGADDSKVNSTTARKTYNDRGTELSVAKTATKPLNADGNWQITQQGSDPIYDISSENCNWAKYPMTFVQVGSGWVFKYDGANTGNYNLWGCAPHNASENYNGSKSIADPCPAGYRVCNKYAFTYIVPTAESGKWTDYTDNNLVSTIGTSGSCRTSGGFQIKYDGTNTTWLPTAGEICNGQKSGNGVLWRTGDYCRYWTNVVATTSSYQGQTAAFDYNNFAIPGTDKSGYARSVRCEKIK